MFKKSHFLEDLLYSKNLIEKHQKTFPELNRTNQSEVQHAEKPSQ